CGRWANSPSSHGGIQLLAQIVAEHVLLQNSAGAIIDNDLARLVGFGPAARLGDGVLTPAELGRGFRITFLADCPASFLRMHSINVASQHLGLSLAASICSPTQADGGRSPRRSAGRALEKETGTGLGRSR